MGDWTGIAYETIDGNTHVALVMGDISDGKDVLNACTRSA